MSQQRGGGKKLRRSGRHSGKRAAALLRRKAAAGRRAIKRAKQIEFFEANPILGSPSQIRNRIKFKPELFK